MVDRRLLERMLELKLLDTVLTKGDLTKRLISQVRFKTVFSNQNQLVCRL